MLPLQKSWQRLSRNLTKVIRLNDNEDISVIDEYPCPALLIRSRSQYGDEQLVRRLYDALPQRDDETEPMMNIVSWYRNDEVREPSIWLVGSLPRARRTLND